MESEKIISNLRSSSIASEITTIYLRPRTILTILLIIIVILISLNSLAIYLDVYTDVAFAKTHRLVDFNEEANIPTFYSSLVIFLCSFSLFLITALAKKAGTPYLGWLGLALIFLFLSVDEAAAIHEIFVGITKRTFNVSGYFRFAWVIPYGLAVVALAVIYIPFLRNLPSNTRLLFLVSGAIFIGGAVGLEMIAGKLLESGITVEQYAALYTLEESMEMVGMALFLYTLLDYLSENLNFNVRVAK